MASHNSGSSQRRGASSGTGVSPGSQSASSKSRAAWMEETLTARFAPQHVAVIDESQRHEGHSGWREGGETHYRIEIVSTAFEGKSRVERHRMVNAALAEAFDNGLHALAITARAPSEK